MRINEIVNGNPPFQATIRVKHGKSSTGVKVIVIVFAESITQARAILSEIFDDINVLSVAHTTPAKINEANLEPPHQIVNPRVFPNRYKHDIAQRALLQNLKRKAMIVRPTADDLKAARSDFEAEQKRVNREYENKQKWAEIRKRRIKN